MENSVSNFTPQPSIPSLKTMDSAPAPSPPGNDHAFLRHILTQENALLRYILRSVPMLSDARDVLQETLLTLWWKRLEFDETRDFLPWAFGVARLKVLEFWRKQPRWESFANGDLQDLLDARQQALEGELSERAERLKECVRKLPQLQCALLHRYYTAEESVETIAHAESRSVESVYKALQRIRRTLADCVERTPFGEVRA
jgi:RNA polymerase sigma-70 factor (ECF subfamily)